jgi:XTP/dITP diphosphohydrolase
MTDLLVASGNSGKVREFAALLSDLGFRVLSLKDFPSLQPAVEDGATFQENAVKKAVHAARATGLPVIADDSGLVVDCLDGRPGVRSARYAGEGAGDQANNALLLAELAGVPSAGRRAAFHCVIAYCLPDGVCRTFDGSLPGIIGTEPVGKDGFGYDPLFLVPEYGKTMAELPLQVKNRISHRGRAFAALQEYLAGRSGPAV